VSIEDDTKRSAERRFLRQTVEVWQPYSPVPLSEPDAAEIFRNLTSFLDLLARWESGKNCISGDAPNPESSSRVLGGGCDRPPGRPRQVRPNARGLGNLTFADKGEDKAPDLDDGDLAQIRCYAGARVATTPECRGPIGRAPSPRLEEPSISDQVCARGRTGGWGSRDLRGK
jgi:hypothetical protein